VTVRRFLFIWPETIDTVLIRSLLALRLPISPTNSPAMTRSARTVSRGQVNEAG
jgi:hypothetical protein